LLLHVLFALYKIAQPCILTCFIYERFIMLKRHLLLASILAGTFAITACSQQTEDNAEAAVESAGDDTAANADAAAAETQETAAEAEVAAQNAGTEIADGAETAGAEATTALENTGEAVVVGANEAVSATAGVVADGASAVEDKASENAVEAEQQY
jgi:hypothetical protein